jgi:hypothetical protein
MDNKASVTKLLAVAGTVLAWIPILFTILTSVVGTARSGTPRFDYLMPAELFPIALVGALLLLLAARRAHSHLRPIRWSFGAAVAFIVGGQAIAVVSGLASGAIEPSGWIWAVVIASIALFSLALVALGIAGILLVKKLYSST